MDSHYHVDATLDIVLLTHLCVLMFKIFGTLLCVPFVVFIISHTFVFVKRFFKFLFLLLYTLLCEIINRTKGGEKSGIKGKIERIKVRT